MAYNTKKYNTHDNMTILQGEFVAGQIVPLFCGDHFYPCIPSVFSLDESPVAVIAAEMQETLRSEKNTGHKAFCFSLVSVHRPSIEFLV